MTFFVRGVEGPLVDGEEERARQWGESVGAEFVRRTSRGRG